MKFLTIPTIAAMLVMSSMTVAETNTDNEVDSQPSTVQTKATPSLTLYNFKTEAEEELEAPQEMSIEKGKEFIPPLPVAEQLYLSYVKQGAKPLEAITYTYVELRKAMSELQASE